MTKHTTTDEQAFLDELDKKLWNAADRLRSNLDAAVYKHAVLGLIFLKYVSDAFDLRREELEKDFRDPRHRLQFRQATPPTPSSTTSTPTPAPITCWPIILLTTETD